MFTEMPPGEGQVSDKLDTENVPQGDGRKINPGRFAFTGKRHTSPDTPPEMKGDIRIDIIQDGDAPPEEAPDEPRQKKSSDISYAERKTGRKT